MLMVLQNSNQQMCIYSQNKGLYLFLSSDSPDVNKVTNIVWMPLGREYPIHLLSQKVFTHTVKLIWTK